MRELYDFILSIPDRLYPFGRAAYERMQAGDFARYGDGHYGVGLLLYRELFHAAGSAAFVLAALTLARLLRSDIVFWSLVAVLAAFITFQEFYLHPHFYGQPLMKGVLDWLAWMVPLAAGAYYFLVR